MAFGSPVAALEAKRRKRVLVGQGLDDEKVPGMSAEVSVWRIATARAFPTAENGNLSIHPERIFTPGLGTISLISRKFFGVSWQLARK